MFNEHKFWVQYDDLVKMDIAQQNMLNDEDTDDLACIWDV